MIFSASSRKKPLSRPFTILCYLAVLPLLLAGCSAVQEEPEVYLFSFFQNNGEDGLHLIWSEDGYNWSPINNNQSLLMPEVGNDQLMRDPCVIQGGDGRFHMVWTVSWDEKGIGYASSPDLINWSAQQYIPVMEHEPEATNCWAPEIFYDEASEQYLIYWSTTIPGRFPETDSSGRNGRNHRMYCTTTKDFENFSETRLLYDQGFNVIDGTIQKIDGEYVMFLKDETLNPEAEKNIRIARSSQFDRGYSPASAPITGDYWAEGPTAIKHPDGWIVYFDRYQEGRMGAVRSTDLKNWTDITEEVSFPEGTRHGTVLKVKQSVLDQLKKAEQPGT